MPHLRTLYAFAIFLASCLLFLAEPMAGKRLAPLFGGSAAVWITCLVFFQTALLLGYCCAHWLATRVGPRRQGRFYLALIAAGLLSTLNPDRKIHADLVHPILSIFWLLIALIGVPFLALSAASPLLQAWHARDVGAKTSSRPGYRLFALSNFGSLAALAAYPALIEPRFTLHAQGVAWSVGYLLYALVCAALVFFAEPFVMNRSDREAAASTPGRLETTQIILWLSLAACGSLLLCAFTAYVSQNVAAIPLFWIVPLIIYLLSFIITFQGDSFYPRVLMLILLAICLGALGYICALDRTDLDLQTALPFYYTALLVCCLFCHGELYQRRPAAAHMTSFYLWVAAGGALGAFFVGVFSPLVFNASYELPCTLVLTAALALVVTWRGHFAWRIAWTAGTLGMLVALGMYAHITGKQSIVKMRNFYGTLRVDETTVAPGGPARILFNGTITHGLQFDSENLRYIPTTYFTEDSGVGLALRLCCGQRPRRVGIIGLGAGSLAVYGRTGDVFRYYEINPLVEKIAHDYFTYLSDSQARIEIATGDARVSLQNEQPQRFDVLALDAFSGDAIPVHLLTREALTLYLRHLLPNGILAFHVSNKYLNLGPVVAQLANDAGLSYINIPTESGSHVGEYGSDWILATADKDILSVMEEEAQPVVGAQGLRLWTDDYNSLLPILLFK